MSRELHRPDSIFPTDDDYDLREVGKAVRDGWEAVKLLSDRACLVPHCYDFDYSNRGESPSHLTIMYEAIGQYFKRFLGQHVSRYVTFIAGQEPQTFYEHFAEEARGMFAFARFGDDNEKREFLELFCKVVCMSERAADLVKLDGTFSPSRRDLADFPEHKRITPGAKHIFKCLGAGLADATARRISHWEIVRYFLHVYLEPLLDVQDAVNREVPWTEGGWQMGTDFSFADYLYFSEMHLVLETEGAEMPSEGKRQRHLLICRPTYKECSWASHEEIVASMLLVPPVYRMCKKIESFYQRVGPRHILQCHNPLCKKLFYSGRSNAKACPSRRGRRKSQCKLVWEAYQKWLKKQRKDLERDWRDLRLQADFKSQYSPRGPQSPLS